MVYDGYDLVPPSVSHAESGHFAIALLQSSWLSTLVHYPSVLDKVCRSLANTQRYPAFGYREAERIFSNSYLVNTLSLSVTPGTVSTNMFP